MEWQKPEWSELFDMRRAGGFVFVIAILLALKNLRLRDIFIILFFGALTFSARRHLQIAMLVTAAINVRLQKDFAREWSESLRVKQNMPLGEDEIVRLLRERNGTQ